MKTSHEKRISVIIPTYNEGNKIGPLIDIVKERGGSAISEIIISDGGSTDQTREIAEAHGAVCIVSPKKGRSYQLNYGAQNAKGGILYFLHADTVPSEDFADLIMDTVNADCLAGSFRRKFDNPAMFFKLSCFIGSFHLLSYPYGDHSLFMDRELFNKIGGYAGMKIMEDQEIIERAAEETRFVVLPQCVITSARKFEEQGIIRLHIIFLLITLMYKIGFKEPALMAVYKFFIR